MISSIRHASKFTTAVLLAYLVGKILIGLPTAPDDFFGWQKKFGVFLVLVFFAAQVWQWGMWVLQNNRYASLLALPVGSAILATYIHLAGLLGTLGPNTIMIHLFVLMAPAFLRPGKATLNLDEDKLFPKYLLAILLSICGIGLLTFIVDGFSLKGHGDVFNYHLPATRFWYDLGSITLVPNFPSAHQAGLWDVFHLWGVELLAGNEGRGLIAVQHFAQWSQVIIAFGGSIGAVYVLFHSMGLSSGLSLMAVIAALSVRGISPSWAKNDWGSTFWVISGIAILEATRAGRMNSRLKYLLLGGFVLGCGVSSKWTTLFFVGSWFLVQVPFWKISELFIAGIASLAGMAGVLIRNWIQVGNPIFPTFPNLFHSPYLIPSLQKDLAIYQSEHFSLSWERGSALFQQILGDTFYTSAFLISPALFILTFKRSNKKLWALHLAAVLGLILFMGKMGQPAPSRLAGPLLVLLASTGFLVVVTSLHLLLKEKLLLSRLAISVLVVLLCAGSNFPLYAFTKCIRYKPSNETIYDFHGGDYKRWIRTHLPAGSTLVITDNEFYYLMGYRLMIYPDYIELQGHPHHEDNSELLFKDLTPPEADYLAFGTGVAQFKALREWVLTHHQNAVLYDQEPYVVLDLHKLRN